MKVVFTVLVLLIACFNTSAQLGFDEHIIIEGEHSTSDGFDIFCGDVDGDIDISNFISGVHFCTLEEKDGKLYSLEIIKI